MATHSATPPGSKHERHMDTGGRSLRSHHRLPYEPPPAATSLVSRRLQNPHAPRRFSELVVQRTQRTQRIFSDLSSVSLHY